MSPEGERLYRNLQRRLEAANNERYKQSMCSCSCGCEAGPNYETAANWPECNCWCHIPMWKKRLAQFTEAKQ